MENNILVLLEQQLDNFPTIRGFLNEKGLKSTTLFLPQSLKGIAEEIKHRDGLLIECFTYLDLVKIYSLTTYDDCDLFTNRIMHIIGSNRVISNDRLVSNKEAVDDFLFTSKEDLENFLLNNNFLISLYIFSMINTMFYKQT